MAAELLGQTQWVRALARIVARDAAAADDLAQEALAAALAGSPPRGEALRPWLAGTVRNLARMGRRGEAHRAARERGAARSARAEDHAATLAEAEAHGAVVREVLALDERDREVLLARYFQGRSVAEIARREGRSLAAVGSQLTRAHQNLRARLEASGGRDRWLAGIAPLLARPAGAGGLTGASSLVLASAWSYVAAAAVVVAIGAFLLLGDPWPGDPARDVVTTGLEESMSEGDPVLDTGPGLAARDARRPLAGGEAVGAAALGSLLATVDAVDEAPIPEGHLWVEGPEGELIADGALGTEGAVALGELPSSSLLTAYLSVAGRRWSEPLGEFQVAPGSRTEQAWTVSLSTRVELVAVDRHGLEVPRQTLGLTWGGSSKWEFASDLRSKQVVDAAQSDQEGRVVFEGVEPGRYRAGVIDYMLSRETTLPDGTRQLHVGPSPMDPGCAVTIPVQVPPNTEHMRIEVPVLRGDRIAGRVVDSEGRALTGVELRAEAKGVGGALETASYEDGRFSFGHVLPGTYSIGSEYSQDGWVLADHVEVESGTEDLLLTLGQAGEVELAVLGPDTDDVWIWFARLGPGSTGPRGTGPYSVRDGGIDNVLRGLQPGPHWISAHDANGTRLGVAWPVDVAPGPLRTSCTIHLERALEVEVINHDSTQALRARPDMGEFMAPGGYAAPGERTVVAVPPGSSTLMIRLDSGPWEPHMVSGSAGERLTIEVGTPVGGTPAEDQ